MTHENELVWNSQFQILYFYTLWMPFNQKFLSIFSFFENNLPNLPIYIIDIEYFKGFGKRFDVSVVPTTIFNKNGKEFKRIEGLVHSQELIDIFNDI